MARPLYTNNAASALAAGITSTQTTIQVQDGMGNLFPTPAGGDYFYITVTSISLGGAFEIMQCTARSGDDMTVVRGSEGTSPQSFNIGDNVQLRITAAGMNFIAGSAGQSTQEDTVIATQGQTVVTFTNLDYSPNTTNLAVFVNGSKQVSGVNFTETNVNTITFTSGLNAGDVVEGISNLSVAAGTIYATDIKYNEGGTGAVTRTLESKLQESISVKDFGAVGDGTTDDTTAIQAAIDAVIAANGGTLYFPAPSVSYKITSALTIDYSGAYYNTNRFLKKIHIVGDGSPSTSITPTAGAYAAINFVGNTTSNEAYFKIDGIRLSSSAQTVGSIGINFNSAAFVIMDDVIIEGFEYGLKSVDLEQIGVYNCQIRFNKYGLYSATGTITSPNSYSFYNTAISNNSVNGATIYDANAFNFNGGSIQYNGVIGGDTTNYGIAFVNAGNGYGTVGFTNMAFEGNGGLGDFVNGQTTAPASISFDNVGFMRTANFYTTTVTGAANNGSGAIRLAVVSTAGLVGKPKVFINNVVGTTEANNAIPWSFTIIDGTHIDLTGSTYTNAYVSGGIVTIVGFGTNNILIDGTSANVTCGITNCSFKNASYYLTSSTRPTIALSNTNSRIWDDGSNYFQSSVEKLTYFQAQQIGDDGSAWASYTPTVTAAGGTFTATATGAIKKINKTVYFQAVVTATAYTATPTAPLTISLPFQAAISCTAVGLNFTNSNSCIGLISASNFNVSVTKDGAFPITANGQVLIISGTYETV